LFLARDSRIFTVLEEVRAELAEMKQMLRSMQRRTVHTDADNTVNVLQELDLPLKDCSGVAALEEKLQDTAYQQCVVSCLVVFRQPISIRKKKHSRGPFVSLCMCRSVCLSGV